MPHGGTISFFEAVLEKVQCAQSFTFRQTGSGGRDPLLCQIAGRLAVTQRDSLTRFAASPLPPSGKGCKANPRASPSHPSLLDGALVEREHLVAQRRLSFGTAEGCQRLRKKHPQKAPVLRRLAKNTLRIGWFSSPFTENTLVMQ